MVEVVEGAGGESWELILNVGRAAESLRGLLGLEAGDPDDGASQPEVVIKLLLGSPDIQRRNKHAGQIVGTVLVTI